MVSQASSELVRTSSASDRALGCGVVESLVKDDDTRGRVGQPRSQLLDVFWVLRSGAAWYRESA